MADIQQQLQAILGDPAAMGQIIAIAQALTGGGAPPKEAISQPEGSLPVEEQNEGTSPPDLAALMGDMDPKFLQLAMRLLTEYTAPDDEKAALLAALRPFLRQERQEKLEQAERLARLSRVARTALTLLREGEGHV